MNKNLLQLQELHRRNMLNRLLLKAEHNLAWQPLAGDTRRRVAFNIPIELHISRYDLFDSPVIYVDFYFKGFYDFTLMDHLSYIVKIGKEVPIGRKIPVWKPVVDERAYMVEQPKSASEVLGFITQRDRYLEFEADLMSQYANTIMTDTEVENRIEKYDNDFLSKQHFAVQEYIKANSMENYTEFGHIPIQDDHCDGFFGERYDLYGSDVLYESSKHVTIKAPNDDYLDAYFPRRTEKLKCLFAWTFKYTFDV